MSAPGFKSVWNHIDREEIVSKLVMQISPADISSWLAAKYPNSNEKKFVLSESVLKKFATNYLDVYTTIKQDFGAAKTALATGNEEELELAIRKMPEYKDLVLATVGKELDLKRTIIGLCAVVETRVAQIFDAIEEDPRNIGRNDRVFLEMVNTLGLLLEKAYKIVENGPDSIIQHNISIQSVESHVNVFYEAIKRTLSMMDLESSLKFMELFNEELSKLKDPSIPNPIRSVDDRLADVQVIHETINQKISQHP